MPRGSGTAPRVAIIMWTCPTIGPPTGVPSRTRLSAITPNRGRAVPAMRKTGPGERNADGATCDCPKGPCPNTAAPKCPCPKMEVDEECLTAVAAPSIIPLLSAPKTREPHWEGHAMHESWPFPLGLQQQEHELGCNSWRGCCNSGCCSSGCFEGPGTKAVTAQVTRCMDCSRAMSAETKNLLSSL